MFDIDKAMLEQLEILWEFKGGGFFDLIEWIKCNCNSGTSNHDVLNTLKKMNVRYNGIRMNELTLKLDLTQSYADSLLPEIKKQINKKTIGIDFSELKLSEDDVFHIMTKVFDKIEDIQTLESLKRKLWFCGVDVKICKAIKESINVRIAHLKDLGY